MSAVSNTFNGRGEEVYAMHQTDRLQADRRHLEGTYDASLDESPSVSLSCANNNLPTAIVTSQNPFGKEGCFRKCQHFDMTEDREAEGGQYFVHREAGMIDQARVFEAASQASRLFHSLQEMKKNNKNKMDAVCAVTSRKSETFISKDIAQDDELFRWIFQEFLFAIKLANETDKMIEFVLLRSKRTQDIEDQKYSCSFSTFSSVSDGSISRDMNIAVLRNFVDLFQCYFNQSAINDIKKLRYCGQTEFDSLWNICITSGNRLVEGGLKDNIFRVESKTCVVMSKPKQKEKEVSFQDRVFSDLSFMSSMVKKIIPESSFVVLGALSFIASFCICAHIFPIFFAYSCICHLFCIIKQKTLFLLNFAVNKLIYLDCCIIV